MDNKEIYQAPESDLGRQESERYTLWRRFYLTFFCAIPVYMFFVMIGTPQESWPTGAIGAVVMAGFSGFIGMVIPAQKKRIFITAGIFIGLAGTLILGMSLGL